MFYYFVILFSVMCLVKRSTIRMAAVEAWLWWCVLEGSLVIGLKY